MTDTPLAQRFADAMGHLLGPDFPTDIGLAVSGGGDSMAMLYLAHNWTHRYGVRLWVVTVDHGLRRESASEAEMVARECAALGWPHATVRWHWDGQGNVQDAARRARLDLIDRWRGALKHVFFAHTMDDQAETVLMRLMRGSGVDGLSGMRSTRHVTPHARVVPLASDMIGIAPPREGLTPGFYVMRPCLDMRREELRQYIRVLHGNWVDDPTNDDRTYERVRVRHLLNVLGEDGITARVLSDTAARLQRARDGLQARLVDAVGELCVSAPLGQVSIDRDGFAALDVETQLRMLTSALCYAASSEYRPRATASEALLVQILSGKGGTLHGAEVLVERDCIRIIRELEAVKETQTHLGELWDGQWELCDDGDEMPEGVLIGALTEKGWTQITDRTKLPVAHRAALSLPAVWENDRLIACPSLGFGPQIRSGRYVLGRPDTGFKAFCLSH